MPQLCVSRWPTRRCACDGTGCWLTFRPSGRRDSIRHQSKSGCAGTQARPDAIFQAASLTKPVVALAALRLVRAGQLALDAPVSRYLPGGYRHFHHELKRSAGDSHDLVPESTLRQIPVAQLLNHSTDEPLGLKWGLGWGIEHTPGGPHLWQWGSNPGFRAFAMASVVSKDGFVLLTNSERGMLLAASVAQAVLPGEHNAFRFHLVA